MQDGRYRGEGSEIRRRKELSLLHEFAVRFYDEHHHKLGHYDYVTAINKDQANYFCVKIADALAHEWGNAVSWEFI